MALDHAVSQIVLPAFLKDISKEIDAVKSEGTSLHALLDNKKGMQDEAMIRVMLKYIQKLDRFK